VSHSRVTYEFEILRKVVTWTTAVSDVKLEMFHVLCGQELTVGYAMIKVALVDLPVAGAYGHFAATLCESMADPSIVSVKPAVEFKHN